MEVLFPELQSIINESEKEAVYGRDARELYQKYIDTGMNSFDAFYKTKESYPTLRKSETKIWVKTIK